MAIIGLALYGSRARGDAAHDADVDLLVITSDARPVTTVRGNLTMSCHPLDEMIRGSRNGDLFALHIVSEAKVLYDEGGVFPKITKAFTYRHDYGREIKLVSDVGWFLVRNSHRFNDQALFNRKLSWCTRTILIARAANQRRPLFSAAALAEFSGSPDVAALISSKERSTIDHGILDAFARFLGTFGVTAAAAPETLEEQKRLFEADRNVAGLRIIRAVMKSI